MKFPEFLSSPSFVCLICWFKKQNLHLLLDSPAALPPSSPLLTKSSLKQEEGQRSVITCVLRSFTRVVSTKIQSPSGNGPISLLHFHFLIPLKLAVTQCPSACSVSNTVMIEDAPPGSGQTLTCKTSSFLIGNGPVCSWSFREYNYLPAGSWLTE